MEQMRQMMELFIVRHGQTFHNIEKTLGGQCDGKLTELGIKQALLTGKRLENQIFDYVYVSALGRTQETFKNMSQNMKFIHLAKEVQISRLIIQKDAGIMEGKPIELYKQLAEEKQLPPREYKPEGGESFCDVYNRAEQFFDLLLDKHMNNTQGKEEQPINIENDGKSTSSSSCQILVITHGGFVREFNNVLNFIQSKAEPIFVDTPQNCSLHIVQINSQQTQSGFQNQYSSKECLDINYKLVNDNSHLSQQLK